MSDESEGQAILGDPSAERAVLGGVFRYGVDAFVEVDDLVTERTFTVESNQAIYKCLRHAFGQDPNVSPDIPTIKSAAASLGLAEFFGDPEELKHLRAVSNVEVNKDNVRKLAAKVRKLEIARAGLVVADSIKNGLLGVTGDEGREAILNLLEAPVFDFADKLKATADTDGPSLLGDGLSVWVEHLAMNPVQQIGLPTGYQQLDISIGGGLRPGSVTTIGARPGVGKTMLGNNIGLHLAAGSEYQWPKLDVVERVPVLYLDTEMLKEDHCLRSLANLANVPMKQIETGQFTRDLQFGPRVREAVELFTDIPFHMKSIAGQPFEETLALMRRWLLREVGLGPDGKAKPCCIIFDYVKLMDSGGLSKHLLEHQLLGFIMTGLHNFAVRYHVPILCFVQLNRDGIEAEDTSAASGSDRIIWLTSNFLIYKPLSTEEMSKSINRKVKYNRKLLPLKTRHGPGLPKENYINLFADYQFARITEGPLQLELEASSPDRGFDAGDENEKLMF